MHFIYALSVLSANLIEAVTENVTYRNTRQFLFGMHCALYSDSYCKSRLIFKPESGYRICTKQTNLSSEHAVYICRYNANFIN